MGVIQVPTNLATASSPGAMPAASAAQSIDIKCEGDITAVLTAAIASLGAANGGTIRLSPGSGYCTAQLTPHTTGASPHKTAKSISIVGAGPSHSGDSGLSLPWPAPNGGTILDLRYAAGPKIFGEGTGSLDIRDMSLVDTTDGTQDFIELWLTTLKCRNVAFYGKPTATITASTLSALASDNSYNDSAAGFLAAGFKVNDVVHVTGFTGNAANNVIRGVATAVTPGKLMIGGTDGDVIVDAAEGESVTIKAYPAQNAIKCGTAGVAFLGFGTIIDGCWFCNIQRGLYGKAYTNNVVFTTNTFAVGSGGECAVELNGLAGFCTGNTIRGNLIEVIDYKYGVKLLNTATENILENGIYDALGATVSMYYFDATSVNNIVTETTTDAGATLMSGPGAGSQTVISSLSKSVFTKPLSHSPMSIVSVGGITANRLAYYDPGPQALLAKADAVATARKIMGVPNVTWAAGTHPLFYDTGIQSILADASCTPVIGSPAYLSGATAGSVTSALTGLMYPRLIGYFSAYETAADGTVKVRMKLDDTRDDNADWVISDVTLAEAASAYSINVTRALWESLTMSIYGAMDGGAAINFDVPSTDTTGVNWYSTTTTGLVTGRVVSDGIGLLGPGAGTSDIVIEEHFASGTAWRGKLRCCSNAGAGANPYRCDVEYSAAAAPNTIGISAAREILPVGARIVLTGRARRA